MTLRLSRIASSAAIAAAFSLSAAPSAASELPHIGAGEVRVVTGAVGEQHQHHRWRRYRDRRVDVGDVITGVLVIGAIAAATGVFNGDRDRRYRDRDYRDERYRDRDDDYRRDRYDSEGLERAADMCVDRIERGDERVEEILDVSRRPDGWHVAGTLASGEGWTCRIDNDGRVREIAFGEAEFSTGYAGDADYAYAEPAGDQWDDDAYLRARARVQTPGRGEYTYRSEERDGAGESQPAYPGGPVAADEGYSDDAYAEVDADLD